MGLCIAAIYLLGEKKISGWYAGLIGGLVTGDRSAYSYLPASVAYLPPPPELLSLISAAGFTSVERQPLSGGIGRAVAGNVGAEHRFEYTVIGDPVNEAARLTTAAKETDALVLVNQSLVEAAEDSEAKHWRELVPMVVRGRTEPTRVATPCA